MKTIEEIWIESGKKKGFKVRFVGWNHRWKHFSIDGYDESGQFLLGLLDNGEKIRYSIHSRHWKAYDHGDEDSARAI